MGYPISWLALRTPRSSALELLGLQPTGEQLELPEAPIVGVELNSGWYLVAVKGCDHALIADTHLDRVSRQSDAITCSIVAHVMFSASSFWSAGERLWSVAHRAELAIDHLDCAGQLPATGFEHDEDGPERFEVLQSAATASSRWSRPWWKFW